MNVFRETIKHIRQFPNVFWLLIAATLINQIGNMALFFLILYLTQYQAFSLSDAAFLFAILATSMLVTGLLAGTLIDKLGFALILSCSLLLNGIVLIIFPLITTKSLMMLLCVIWGFTYGLYRPASQTFVSHLSRPGMNKITFSVYRLALNLGMSVGPAIGGYLAARSFIYIFMMNGIANLSACLMLIVGLMGTATCSYQSPKPTQKTEQIERKKLEFSVTWLKKDAVLTHFILGMVPISMIFFQHESTLAVFLHEDLKFPLSFYGFLFTINTLLIVFFELPLNVATIHWPYRINFMLGSLLISLGFSGLYFANQEWAVILLTILWTLGEMVLYPAANSFIADIAPLENRGSYMALFSTCSNLGLLLGPLTGALIMERFGANILWLACGIWGALSIIIFHSLNEQNHNEKERSNVYGPN
jgi:MFS family permease